MSFLLDLPDDNEMFVLLQTLVTVVHCLFMLQTRNDIGKGLSICLL